MLPAAVHFQKSTTRRLLSNASVGQTKSRRTLLGSKRDERLATLFHKLGIVLFELGRGDHYRNVFRWRANPDEHAVLAEIDKISFRKAVPRSRQDVSYGKLTCGQRVWEYRLTV